jgi:hypothetical protein
MGSHMRYCTAMLLAFLAAPLLGVQETPPQSRPALDSSLVRYCRYPSPVCGTSNLNPSQARSVRDLTSLESRRGSHSGQGALVGTSLDNWEAVPQ